MLQNVKNIWAESAIAVPASLNLFRISCPASCSHLLSHEAKVSQAYGWAAAVLQAVVQPHVPVKQPLWSRRRSSTGNNSKEGKSQDYTTTCRDSLVSQMLG